MRILLVLLLAVWGWSATYYMRADGTATKANAVGPATDATKCMSDATHNAATYLPNDTLIISSLGGIYRAGLLPPSNVYSIKDQTWLE